MSRPKHWWYGQVRKAIMTYNYLADDDSEMAERFRDAITLSLVDTANMSNGTERVHAVDDVLIRKTKTIQGVALETNYSYKTVQMWVIDFVYLVGRKAGF